MADEMHDFYETEDFTHMYEEGSTPSMDADSYTGIPGDGDLVLVTKHDLERRLEEAAHTNQAYVSTQEQSVSAGGRAGGRGTSDSAAQYDEMANMSEMGTQSSGVGGAKGMASHSIGVGGGVDMSEAGVQSSLQTFMHSIGTQGSAGYSQSFEHDVLVMLQKMNDRMADMRSNPTVTQKEINQQEQMQQQLIQSTIGMSLKDPEVMKNLLAMLKEQLPKPSIRRRNSTAFADLQAKLLQAQEEQRQETMKHYETQTEFQEYMRRQLEEQSKQQMMGLQTNFEMYSKKMQEQLAEQQRRWDEELKKRRDEEPKSDKKRKRSRDKRSKKPRKPKAVNRGSSDSSQSDTDEGVMLQAPKQNKPKVVSFPAIKTMQAKILTQNLLEDDEMRTDSQVSIEKIKKKQEARGKLTRMDTVMKFDHASEAMRRYESTGVVTHISEKDEGTTDNDPDDEEMIQVQAVRPVTLKRAEIKTQSGSGFTPARPAPAPPDGKGKVGRIQRIESGSDADQVLDQHSTEGAGSELSQKLKKRWQRN